MTMLALHTRPAGRPERFAKVLVDKGKRAPWPQGPRSPIPPL